MKNGYGEFHWVDGSIYKGHFVNNKLSGKGIFFLIKKKVYTSGMMEKFMMVIGRIIKCMERVFLVGNF